MGFLSGAYGKLMAGQLVRDIQYQLTGVQSRLRRVTRELGQKEKMYQAQDRNMKQAMQSQMQAFAFGFLRQNPNMNVGAMSSYDAMSMFGAAGQDVNFMNDYSKAMQMAQMQVSGAQTIWQNLFELQRDADLQALKDLESDLQTEKDNLESRLQIAKAEYDAKKEEEKDGAKNLKPDYTGQG